MVKTVNNLKEFLQARQCGEKTFAEVERNTYKYTDCGAWIKEETEDREYAQFFVEEGMYPPETYKHPVGIAVGSIVEGVDWGTDTHILHYPFKIQEFWDVLKNVEDEAKYIWNDTHGCDDCGIEHPEWGTQMINPECKTCEGEGVII